MARLPKGVRKMLTVEEWKRLDELELLCDLGPMKPHQKDELEVLRDRAHELRKGQERAALEAIK